MKIEEVPQVPTDKGLRAVQMMTTSFSLRRQKLLMARKAVRLLKSSENTMEFFKFPANRLVELGSQPQI